MRQLVRALVGVVLVAVTLALVHVAIIEAAGEMVLLTTFDATGKPHQTRLWIVDDETGTWLLGSSSSGWMERIRAQPTVTVVNNLRKDQWSATPVPDAREHVLHLMRQKYGWADRWVRLLTGGDAVPVRLDPY